MSLIHQLYYLLKKYLVCHRFLVFNIHAYTQPNVWETSLCADYTAR